MLSLFNECGLPQADAVIPAAKDEPTRHSEGMQTKIGLREDLICTARACELYDLNMIKSASASADFRIQVFN